MKVTKTTKIDVSVERERIREINARIRVVNQLTSMKYKALGMKAPKLSYIPIMTQDITRHGITVRLSVESSGLVATSIIGKTKVVLYHDANTNLWLNGLYAGKGKEFNMLSCIGNSKISNAVANISKSAKTIINEFNLGKMNTVKRISEIRDNCLQLIEDVLPTLEEAEKALGIIEDDSIDKNAKPLLIKSTNALDIEEVAEITA